MTIGLPDGFNNNNNNNNDDDDDDNDDDDDILDSLVKKLLANRHT